MLTAQTESAQLRPDLHLAKTLVPLKSMLESHLAVLLQDATVDMLFAGQVLFAEGSYDQQHIYLLHGDVELRYPDGRTLLEKGRSLLYPLVSRQPRPCKAVARTDCSIMRLERDALDKLLTWSQIAEYLLVDISYQRDLDEDADWMMTVLKSNLFFKVPPINVQQIFSRFTPMVVDTGEVILRQGEIGDGCYFIKEGEAVVTRSPDSVSRPQPVANITVGRCFGEDALVNETVRNATVTMSSNGVLMRLEKRDFFLLLKEPEVDLISSRQLMEALEAGAVCIDCRTEDEYMLGHIREAVNIPLNLLRIKMRLLDKNRNYILYCDTGRRSRAAVHLLNQQGFHTLALSEGLNGIPASLWKTIEDTRQDFLLRDGQVVRGQ